MKNIIIQLLYIVIIYFQEYMTRKKSERELEQIVWKLEYAKEKLKVFIADIVPNKCCKRENMEDRMIEVENLVNTFGWLVILKHIQKRWIPDYKTYIWNWKLEEIANEMKLKWANLLIFWNILKSHQIYNINNILRKFWAKAWDRVDLILKIFERHAKTKESRLQIELASIKHMWPRIFGMWMELSRQWWGSKLARWKWETNTEIMKRHLKKREIAIKKELEKYQNVRNIHRKWRKKKGFFTIWIVWYTNAGKSSLLNALTSKWVLAENKLFATLWTSIWKMYIKSEEIKLSIKKKFRLNNYEWFEMLLNDTIWFIRDLPPNLIEAFRSTLEDSIESDLLLHVVDISDKKVEEKIKVVDDILDKIWAKQTKIYIFNKIDLVNNIEKLKIKFLDFNPVFVSSYKKKGLKELKKEILKKIN